MGKKNLGSTLGSAIGGIAGTLIAPGVGTSIGASLGGAIGGSFDKDEEEQPMNTAPVQPVQMGVMSSGFTPFAKKGATASSSTVINVEKDEIKIAKKNGKWEIVKSYWDKPKHPEDGSQNPKGDTSIKIGEVIIPRNKVKEVRRLIKEGDSEAINKIVDSLPVVTPNAKAQEGGDASEFVPTKEYNGLFSSKENLGTDLATVSPTVYNLATGFLGKKKPVNRTASKYTDSSVNLINQSVLDASKMDNPNLLPTLKNQNLRNLNSAKNSMGKIHGGSGNLAANLQGLFAGKNEADVAAYLQNEELKNQVLAQKAQIKGTAANQLSSIAQEENMQENLKKQAEAAIAGNKANHLSAGFTGLGQLGATESENMIAQENANKNNALLYEQWKQLMGVKNKNSLGPMATAQPVSGVPSNVSVPAITMPDIKRVTPNIMSTSNSVGLNAQKIDIPENPISETTMNQTGLNQNQFNPFGNNVNIDPMDPNRSPLSFEEWIMQNPEMQNNPKAMDYYTMYMNPGKFMNPFQSIIGTKPF